MLVGIHPHVPLETVPETKDSEFYSKFHKHRSVLADTQGALCVLLKCLADLSMLTTTQSKQDRYTTAQMKKLRPKEVREHTQGYTLVNGAVQSSSRVHAINHYTFWYRM